VTGILKAADENYPLRIGPQIAQLRLYIDRHLSRFQLISKKFIYFQRKRGTRGSRFEGFQFFFTEAMNSSMGIAGMLKILMVPLAPSSIETLAIVSLFGASTIFTKS
jgi:hypothetical protein